MKRYGPRGFLASVVALLLAGALAGCPDRRQQADPPPAPTRRPESGASRRAGASPDVRGLPWVDDPAFRRAREAAGTPVLMSAFQASLPDPILDERHNIALAADHLKGAVVQPGAVFSLNTRIGRRTTRRGFKPGPQYQGSRMTATVGGGVCKVATVLYNAAILADQEIVERHPHSMTVPYVPPGQDATISYGSADFRFRNVTGSPLLIWAQNVGDSLHIALYGPAPPPRVEWLHKVVSRTEGRVVVHSWVRVTRAAGRVIIKDLGTNSYRPAPAKLSPRIP